MTVCPGAHLTQPVGTSGPPSIQSVLENLLVFKDEPLFGPKESFDPGSDTFNHAAFAETLLRLIRRNDPPLTIGLFGSWGIGKSTILNILSKNIERSDGSKLKFIYFNAWKYSGDSFRRQFLIEVARQIYGGEHEEVNRLQELNYSAVLKRSHRGTLIQSIAQVFRDAFETKIAFRGTAVVRFLMGCMSLLLMVCISAAISLKSPIVSVTLLVTGVPAVFLWFSRIKFEELFVFQEAPIYDPKLIFPEQFEDEFRALVKREALEGRRLVIAIDDIDRCEASVIKDILISTKNFIGDQNCFFIVPCDDRTVVDVFTEPRQKVGYRDESLRKYFNVGLRIPPITSTDLIDFANQVARRMKIPDGVVQVAVLANCRDARKMKHFLNSFALKYQIAKAREAARQMPRIVDENLLELAKAVLIEDAYPDLFAKIVENPRICLLLESAVSVSLGENEKNELMALGLSQWSTEFPGLKGILETTRYIHMTHASVFFSLKSPNQEVRIPRGTEFTTAVIEGNTSVLDDIVREIVDPESKTATADLLVDLLRQGRDRFLHRSISAALRLYTKPAFFAPQDRRRLAECLTYSVCFTDSVGILKQSSAELLPCARDVGSERFSEILDKYLRDIRGLGTFAPPEDFGLIISDLYPIEKTRRELANAVNGKSASWCTRSEGIEFISRVVTPPGIEAADVIPSDSVVQTILSHMAPQESETSINKLKLQIISSHWKVEYAKVLVPFFEQILHQTQNVTTYTPEIGLLVDSIVANKPLLEAPETLALWPPMRNVYNRLTDPKGKFEMAKAVFVFAVRLSDAANRSAARTFVLEIWKVMTDSELRAFLTFAESIDSPETEELIMEGVGQEHVTLGQELHSPTDRTFARVIFCLENENRLRSQEFQSTVIRSLDSNNDDVLGAWLQFIQKNLSGFGSDFPSRLVFRGLDLVASDPGRPVRQALLLEAIARNLGLLSIEDRKATLVKYFSILKDSQLATRNIVASALSSIRSALSETLELRILIANAIDDLSRDVATAQLPQYRSVLTEFLKQSDLLGEHQWKEIARLSQRLMSQQEMSLQELGLALVENMPALPKDDEENIIHLLIAFSSPTSGLRERSKCELERLSLGDLDVAAKGEIDSWRKREETIS